MENRISETVKKEIIGKYEISLIWHKDIWRYHIMIIDLKTYGVYLFKEYTGEEKQKAHDFFKQFLKR